MWGAYVRSLPVLTSEAMSPVPCFSASVEDLLRGAPRGLVDEALREQAWMRQGIKRLRAALRASHAAQAWLQGRAGWRRYVWARYCVRTRGFVTPSLSLALIPCVDWCNHRFAPNAEVDWFCVPRSAEDEEEVAAGGEREENEEREDDEDGESFVLLRALQRIEPGAQVCVSYGESTARDFWSTYGFLPGDDDTWTGKTVPVALPVPTTEDWLRPPPSALALLASRGADVHAVPGWDVQGEDGGHGDGDGPPTDARELFLLVPVADPASGAGAPLAALAVARALLGPPTRVGSALVADAAKEREAVALLQASLDRIVATAASADLAPLVAQLTLHEAAVAQRALLALGVLGQEDEAVRDLARAQRWTDDALRAALQYPRQNT
jgi:SET domain